MTVETDVGTGAHFRLRQDERQFRWFYAVIFTISLVLAALSRLAPWAGRGPAGEPAKSIIHEARTRTNRIVPFFFMG